METKTIENKAEMKKIIKTTGVEIFVDCIISKHDTVRVKIAKNEILWAIEQVSDACLLRLSDTEYLVTYAN